MTRTTVAGSPRSITSCPNARGRPHSTQMLRDPPRRIGQAGPGSPYTGIVVYFRVDDVDTALARAEQLGGSQTLDPVSLPQCGAA
jgi:predicted enzyme related to lactoylglutathione lyase